MSDGWKTSEGQLSGGALIVAIVTAFNDSDWRVRLAAVVGACFVAATYSRQRTELKLGTAETNAQS